MKNFLILFALIMIFSCSNQKKEEAPVPDSSRQFVAAGRSVQVYNTAESTDLRLTRTDKVQFKKADPIAESRVYVFFDPDKTFQTFLGIGGALTDAAAETFAKLPEEKQKELLGSYYDTVTGIGYTLARTNINSCDFSSDSYTYIEEGDSSLKTFNIEHDRKFKIPLIKKALEASGGQLTLFASPWSPPAFMKDNDNMLHGGKLKPEFYLPWARYYTKFIKSYEQEGVPVWGITIQNEPMATQTWESCIYSSEDERDFLKNYLGPVMEKEGLKEKKIIVWDHNRDLIVQRAEVIYDDPVASGYAWGTGFHWYEDWSGGDKMYGNVGIVHELYPEKSLLFTEGTPASFNPDRYGSWRLGEKYGESMIRDFNNWTVGWTDWNILLDEQGGPNHVGNFCFAPVHANTKTGELIYTNSYYYIGHFSKFIRPGAKRILCSPSRSQLLTTGFKNQDGSVVIIVMNETDKGTVYNLYCRGYSVELTSLPHSIQTVITF
jgi:glucosylceramidase